MSPAVGCRRPVTFIRSSASAARADATKSGASDSACSSPLASSSSERQGRAKADVLRHGLFARLEPPALRLVSPQHDAAFFVDASKLRASLDKERTEEPAGGDVFSEDSDD